jgi:hypothetical protein
MPRVWLSRRFGTERAHHSGQRRFRCRTCGKQFNERSAGSLNRTQCPSHIVALVVLWRLCHKLALRDLPEMFLTRGIVFSHEAVRDWEAKLKPALAESFVVTPVRQGGSQLVCRRDLHQGSRALALSLPCHRSLGGAGRRDVQRVPRHGCREGILRVGQDGHRRHARPGHHGWARQLSPRDPDDLGSRCAPSRQPVSQ